MKALPETYSFLNSKLVINGFTITDFATDITLGPVNGDGRWIETEGPGGTVTRSRNIRNLWACSFGLTVGSKQIDFIEGLAIADEKTGAGSFPFVFSQIDGTHKVVGSCWIHENQNATVSKTPGSRQIVLHLFTNAAFVGRT